MSFCCLCSVFRSVLTPYRLSLSRIILSGTRSYFGSTGIMSLGEPSGTLEEGGCQRWLDATQYSETVC